MPDNPIEIHYTDDSNGKSGLSPMIRLSKKQQIGTITGSGMKSTVTLSRLITSVLTFFVLGITSCLPASPNSAQVNEQPKSIAPTVTFTQTANYVEAEEPPVILDPANAYLGMIRFDHLSIEEGLSESVVTCILQDSEGFLWFGTEDGLNRYDGYFFQVIKPNAESPNSISDRWITALQNGNDGSIWIGTRQGGLNHYNTRTAKFVQFKHNPLDLNSPSSNSINALLMDTEGNLWIGTSQGLDMYDPQLGKFTHYNHKPEDPLSLSGDEITALLEDHMGNIWAGTGSDGLNRISLDTGVIDRYSQDSPSSGLTGSSITSLLEDKLGWIWIGTTTGLTRFDQENVRFIRYLHQDNDPNSLVDNHVLSLFIDRNTDVWIGTMGGLERYINFSGKFIHYQHDPGVQDSLNNNIIYSIYEDAGQVFWVGTYGGGINKYDRWKDQFSYYRHDPDNPTSLSNNMILSIFVDHSDIVWLGTFGGGLNRFDRQTKSFTVYQHDPQNPQSISSNNLYAIEQDRDGFLWVGTPEGLDRFDPHKGTVEHFVHNEDQPASLSRGTVNDLLVDHTGILWIATDTGLDKFDDATMEFTHYLHETSHSSKAANNSIITLFEDKKGRLWIGTFNNGLYLYDPKLDNEAKLDKFSHYVNDPRNIYSLSNDSISVFFQDSLNNIWIGTVGGGLNIYQPDTGTFLHFDQGDGLANDVIHGILEDANGNLWVSTNFGISKFNPKKLTFKNYTASDGLQSNEFSPNAFATDNEGEFYFGGINGLTVFDPSKIRDSSYLPPIVLTSLTQDGKAINPGTSPDFITDVTLTWPNNSFEFEFASLGYAQPKKNQYAYMLESFDKTWYSNGTKRDGRYTNLPGGTYTLRLIGSNQDVVWNNTGKSIQITVIPPFWSTWLFRGVSAMLFLGAVYAGYRIRIRNMRTRNVELEKQIHVRTRQIQQRNQEMEALYKADEKMYRYLNIHQAMQALVDVAVDILKADKSCVLGWDDEKDLWVIKVSRGLREQTIQTMTFQQNEGIIGLVGTKGKTVVVNHSKTDPSLKNERREIFDAIQQEDIRSFALLPIRIGTQIYGIFNLCFTRSNAFNPEMVRLFSALSQRASLSIENALLFEQTKELAILEERTRLAHDLHDSAKQKAFAALAQLGTAGGIVKKNPAAAREHLEEAENLVSEVIQELTFLIQEMYPMALKEKGLLAAMREYIFEWENRTNISVELKTENITKLPLNFEQAFYRITQEALANIARHSQATQVKISLVFSTRFAQLRIEDNGKGFNPIKHPMGIGLRSMQERTSSLDGRMIIEGNPGSGACLTVMLPLRLER